MNDTSTASPSGSNRPPGAIVANCCGAWWTGLSACHCAGCHRTFTGITAFDQHRVGGACRDPGISDLVPVQKRYWAGWGHPGDRPVP